MHRNLYTSCLALNTSFLNTSTTGSTSKQSVSTILKIILQNKNRKLHTPHMLQASVLHYIHKIFRIPPLLIRRISEDKEWLTLTAALTRPETRFHNLKWAAKQQQDHPYPKHLYCTANNRKYIHGNWRVDPNTPQIPIGTPTYIFFICYCHCEAKRTFMNTRIITRVQHIMKDPISSRN